MTRRILSEIAKTIRKEGDEITKQPVPDEMAALLAQLEESAAQEEAPEDSAQPEKPKS